MKFNLALILLSVGGSSAFVNPMAATKANVAVRLSDNTVEVPPVVPTEEPAAPKFVKPQMSESLPFLERPAALDGSLAADAGFDPFGFAKTKSDLINYREAEIKHARLAMLAAAGWPLSEVFDKKIAAALNLAPILDASDRAPSIFNGGLGKISPAYWVVTILAAAAIDFYGIQRSKSNTPGYFPGNFGFDPLGLYPKEADSQKWMQTAEIKNGRLAMIAITAFAVQEFVSKLGVVDETPIFFKPVNEALQEYANTGYTLH